MMAEIARDAAMLDELGLILDTGQEDHRRRYVADNAYTGGASR